eukprot:TRINITY_DN4658_c0_g1_i3.p1 TRINITY_DN4658_c0_g1~~TRINITY_DN4658_c0_g1_i3.p1  ORF type:complete len:179 (-),score=30.31 TRINITY_DN4658_c0_g1_i3:131-667(-)
MFFFLLIPVLAHVELGTFLVFSHSILLGGEQSCSADCRRRVFFFSSSLGVFPGPNSDSGKIMFFFPSMCKGQRNGNSSHPLNRSLFVLYQSVDEIIVFLTGGGEENEITLSMALAEIVSMFQFNFKKGITEALFISNYSQIILWLDEVITNGFINLTDRALVEQFNALTWKDEKKSKK